MEFTVEQALTRVEAFLSAPERHAECLNINQYLGLVVGSLSSPVVVSDVDVGFELLREDQAGIDQWFDFEQDLRHAWVTLNLDLAEHLNEATLDLAAEYAVQAGDRGPSREFSSWCDGYLRGYMLAQEQWEEAYAAFDAVLKQSGQEEGALRDQHMSLLSLMASIADWPQALAENPDPERLQQNFPMMVNAMQQAVLEFYRLALDLEEASMEDDNAPHERATPKIGRNDPCPCGSGKKYKKCCLH